MRRWTAMLTALLLALCNGASIPTVAWDPREVLYRLDGLARGTHYRLLMLYGTNPHRCDAGVGSGWDFRGVLGHVPVADDGSACLEVPPRRLLFLEALDEEFCEIRRMRSYLALMPGETQSCVGCHEPPASAPPVRRRWWRAGCRPTARYWRASSPASAS